MSKVMLYNRYINKMRYIHVVGSYDMHLFVNTWHNSFVTEEDEFTLRSYKPSGCRDQMGGINRL